MTRTYLRALNNHGSELKIEKFVLRIDALVIHRVLEMGDKMSHEMQVLGDSPFNYDSHIYTPHRFYHYYQQINHILPLAPRRMLEIGPGDHTITDFFRRKGVRVKTFDNDAQLFPDYSGDIRQPLNIEEKFDLILASKILEHMNFRFIPQVLENIKRVLEPNGYFVVSVPYAVVRFFPPNSRYGKILSCEGRLNTYMPYDGIHRNFGLALGLYRMMRGNGFNTAPYGVIPPLPDDKFDAHHWEVGRTPTTLKAVRKVMRAHFRIVEEDVSPRSNSVFWVLRKREMSS